MPEDFSEHPALKEDPLRGFGFEERENLNQLGIALESLGIYEKDEHPGYIASCRDFEQVRDKAKENLLGKIGDDEKKVERANDYLQQEIGLDTRPLFVPENGKNGKRK